MEKQDLIPCASCLEPTGLVWAITSPSGFVVCGKDGCAGWVYAKGERIFTTSATALAAIAARPAAPHGRKRAVCHHCHHWLPTARRHQFLDGPQRYCTLTCMQAAQRQTGALTTTGSARAGEPDEP